MARTPPGYFLVILVNFSIFLLQGVREEAWDERVLLESLNSWFEDNRRILRWADG